MSDALTFGWIPYINLVEVWRLRLPRMEEGKKSENHLTSAAAFVEGGVQEACDDACSICLEAFCESEPSTVPIEYCSCYGWLDLSFQWSNYILLLQVTVCKHEFHLQCILEWYSYLVLVVKFSLSFSILSRSKPVVHHSLWHKVVPVPKINFSPLQKNAHLPGWDEILKSPVRAWILKRSGLVKSCRTIKSHQTNKFFEFFSFSLFFIFRTKKWKIEPTNYRGEQKL